MYKKSLFFAVFVGFVCLVACGKKDEELKNFQSLAHKFYSNDGSLSREEIDSLKNSFKADSVDAFIDTLHKILTDMGLSIDKKILENPPSEQLRHFTLVVERSQSMEGYVNGATEFQTTLYGLISDLENEFSGEQRVCLIGRTMECKGKDASLERYTRILTADSLKISEKGKKKSVDGSDLNAVLDTVLTIVNDSTMIALVSDFIFAPENFRCLDEKTKQGQDLKKRQEQDLDNLMAQQEIGIKSVFAKKLEKFNHLSVLVLQFYSNFNGDYFDKNDCKKKINQARPYYIWLIGSDLQIAKLLKNQKLEQLKNYKNKAFFSAANSVKIPIEIGYPAIEGNFSSSELRNAIISNAKPSKNGVFSFSVYVDFSKILENYSKFLNFLDSDNYKINNADYQLEILPVEPAHEFIFIEKATHKLNINTNQKQEFLADAEIKISLHNYLPEWVALSSSKDDSAVIDSTTFGLNYLLGGVYSAFVSKGNNLANFDFTIKRVRK